MIIRRLDIPKYVIWEILDEIPYPDIINFCGVSKGLLSQCHNKRYWQHRIRKDFGGHPLDTDNMKVYDNIYRCLRGGMYECIMETSRKDERNLFDFFVEYTLKHRLGYAYEALANAAGFRGRQDIIDRLGMGYPDTWRTRYMDERLIHKLFTGAAEGGQTSIMNKWINLVDREDLVEALYVADAAGRRLIMDDPYRGPITDANAVLREAAKRGNIELINEIIDLENHQNIDSVISGATEGKQAMVLEEVFKWGVTPDDVIEEVAENKYWEIVPKLVELGATDLVGVVIEAIKDGNLDVARRWLDPQDINFNIVLQEAAYTNRRTFLNELINLFGSSRTDPTKTLDIYPALNGAALNNRREIIHDLLGYSLVPDFGIRISTRDFNDVIGVANQRGNYEIASDLANFAKQYAKDDGTGTSTWYFSK